MSHPMPQTQAEPLRDVESLAFDYQEIIQQLITEDDEPVDNIPSAKQQRLLTEPLYSSWDGAGHKFLVEANVGVFAVMRNPAIVPDVLLSLDVEVHEDWWAKDHRSYFCWEFGKPPELVIEIVSNKVGGEQDEKKRKYALMRVLYYLVYDPLHYLSNETLTIYRLDGLSYRRIEAAFLPEVNLGVTLWQGNYEEVAGNWLRWTDAQGELIPTGKESAHFERAEKERERAEKEAALTQAARLTEQLRALGIDPHN